MDYEIEVKRIYTDAFVDDAEDYDNMGNIETIGYFIVLGDDKFDENNLIFKTGIEAWYDAYLRIHKKII